MTRIIEPIHKSLTEGYPKLMCRVQVIKIISAEVITSRLITQIQVSNPIVDIDIQTSIPKM